MNIAEHPSLKFRFDKLAEIFDQFVEADAEENDDRAYLLYLKFKHLSELIAAECTDVAGHKTHFDEEAGRVMGWMEYVVGFNDAPGYCSEESSARYILRNTLNWG